MTDRPEFIQVPENIRRLATLALHDLLYGPIYNTPDHPFGGPDDGRPWPGFIAACRAIRKWADKRVPHALYYEPDAGCWSDSAPEGEFEDGIWYDGPDFYEVDGLQAVLFGVDASRYQRELLKHI